MPGIRSQWGGKPKAKRVMRRVPVEKVKITKTVPVKKMKDTQKAQVLSLMRKMIHKNVENKEVGLIVEEDIEHNSGITNADCYGLVPQIAEGVDGSTRLGDRVKPLSLQVKGVISLSDENPDTKPFYVRVIMASQKDVKNAGKIPTDLDTSHLLRCAVPGASEIPFDATSVNQLSFPVNDNKFKVHYDKKFLLAPVSAASGNNGERSQFTFSKTLKDLPAQFYFDEGSGDWPNNFAPFIAIGYCYADGTGPDVATTRIIANVYSRLTYEDA